MNALTLEEVLQQVHKLPSLPVVVLELLASIDQEDTNVDVLAAKLSQDQALTAKTLRLANSSFYGMAHQVTTMQQSISILGFRTIRSVATTAALVGALPNTAGEAFDLPAFWRHGIATALCARELAPSFQVNPDHAYTAGLLHDIGLLVLVTQFNAHFTAALQHQAQHGGTLTQAEQVVMGLDHAAVGLALTRHWKFPEALQQAVADHHTAHTDQEGPLVTVVRVADAMAHALSTAMEEDAEVPAEVLSQGAAIGMPADAISKMVLRVKKNFASASLVLSP
jgi:putative nucleotidyltransferase with HDIG domain